MAEPVKVLCLYRIKEGQETAFRELLRRHWPTLRQAGLATGEPALHYQSQDREGKTTFVEIFDWVEESSADTAHEAPEVMRVWEPMGSLCDGMEFLHIDRFEP